MATAVRCRSTSSTAAATAYSTTPSAGTCCRTGRSGRRGGADDRCRRWGWCRSPTASTEAVAVADGRSPRRSARALFLACVQEDICRAWQELAAEAAPTRAQAKARGFRRPYKARRVDAFAFDLRSEQRRGGKEGGSPSKDR